MISSRRINSWNYDSFFIARNNCTFLYGLLNGFFFFFSNIKEEALLGFEFLFFLSWSHKKCIE